MSSMEVGSYLRAVHRDGRTIARLAAELELSTPVPTCPGWRMRDLLRHLGFVHRWAARYVSEGLVEMVDEPDEEAILARGPSDAELPAWLAEGHAALVAALSCADPAVSCWTFLEAPTPLHFWARRQAHETAVHRVDAELSAGRATAFDARFASDGIDELLAGFLARNGGEGGGTRLQVHADDTGDDWVVSIGLAVTARRGTEGGDDRLSGGASDLYLLLWNRAEAEDLDLSSRPDPDLIGRWRELTRIRWS